jgi:hypothetical protein
VKRTADAGELKNFALAYSLYFNSNGKGPSNVKDLGTDIPGKNVEAFQDDSVYVVKWNLRNVSGSTIIAYVKEPDSFGTRMVAKGDGSVVRMNKNEFEQAMSGR